MDKAQAIHSFWSGFLTAYNENSVPEYETLTYPYITYDLVIDSFGREVGMSAMLHYRDQSWRDINYKVAEIESYIGRGGRWIAFDGGKALIRRAQPFAQPRSDANDSMIKQFIINISCEYVTE